MGMRHFEPLTLLQQLQGEMNRVLEGFPFKAERNGSKFQAMQWSPTTDITEDEKEYKVRIDLPGVDPKNVEITMDNNLLSIKGHREQEIQEKSKADNYIRVERNFGSFHRQFTLPNSTEPDKISARYHQGVLEIQIPKSESKESKRINIEYTK